MVAVVALARNAASDAFLLKKNKDDCQRKPDRHNLYSPAATVLALVNGRACDGSNKYNTRLPSRPASQNARNFNPPANISIALSFASPRNSSRPF